MIELSSKISDYIRTVFGEEFLGNYKDFQESKYPLTIRISGDNIAQDSIVYRLKDQGIIVQKVNSLPNAYEVKKGSELIGKTVEHLLGYYYIQSLSSMIPSFVLNPSGNEKVLDLCAAPGSKTTQIAEMMNYQGTLIANEPNLNRIKALIHNLDKMNALNMRVIKEKGQLLSKRYPEFFDKILVDAPCSALGVIQKKQEVSNWWSSNSVENISSLQLKLLISAVKMLRTDGELIYSTCTMTIEENERIIDKLLKKYPVELIEFDLKLKHMEGYTEINQLKFDRSLSLTKRILPWDINSEGFFIAKLKKNNKIETASFSFSQNRGEKSVVNSSDKVIKTHLIKLAEYYEMDLKIFEKYKFIIKGNDINFTNINSTDDNPDYYMRIGTKFGIIDKNRELKLHSHAAQIIGNSAKKNIVVLQNSQDLQKYFSGGTIKIPNCTIGQKLIKFKQLIIGTGVCFGEKLKSQFPRSKRTGALEIM